MFDFLSQAFKSLLGQHYASTVSTGSVQQVLNYFCELNVKGWHGKFNVPKMPWAAYGSVAAGFASLSRLKRAEATIHKSRCDLGAVFVVSVGGLYFGH